MQAFIHVRKDGSVEMRGGVCFHAHPTTFNIDRQEDGAKGVHEFEGLTFISILPRWWQVGKWLWLLRLLRRNTLPPGFVFNQITPVEE
jgi:hypothetical protein